MTPQELTLRDYFAVMVMPALIEAAVDPSSKVPGNTTKLVALAYDIADDMLKEGRHS